MKLLKRSLFALVFILIGATATQIPDLVGLYDDHVTDTYQKKYCDDKKIGPDQCSFDLYFYPMQKERPKLVEFFEYFQLSEGPLYFILSGRCSNMIFHNPSAAPKDTGKITNREYFFSRCSQFDQDVSDLIFGVGTKK
jgi:hypothetical protein